MKPKKRKAGKEEGREVVLPLGSLDCVRRLLAAAEELSAVLQTPAAVPSEPAGKENGRTRQKSFNIELTDFSCSTSVPSDFLSSESSCDEIGEVTNKVDKIYMHE